MESKALFEEYFARLMRGDLGAVDELRVPEAPSHGLAAGPLSNDQLKAFHERLAQALSDREVIIDRFVQDGDRVALSMRFRGTTHDGRPVEFRGMGFARVESGRIVEGDNLWDVGALLDQVGGQGSAMTLDRAIATLL